MLLFIALWVGGAALTYGIVEAARVDSPASVARTVDDLPTSNGDARSESEAERPIANAFSGTEEQDQIALPDAPDLGADIAVADDGTNVTLTLGADETRSLVAVTAFETFSDGTRTREDYELLVYLVPDGVPLPTDDAFPLFSKLQQAEGTELLLEVDLGSVDFEGNARVINDTRALPPDLISESPIILVASVNGRMEVAEDLLPFGPGEETVFIDAPEESRPPCHDTIGRVPLGDLDDAAFAVPVDKALVRPTDTERSDTTPAGVAQNGAARGGAVDEIIYRARNAVPNNPMATNKAAEPAVPENDVDTSDLIYYELPEDLPGQLLLITEQADTPDDHVSFTTTVLFLPEGTEIADLEIPAGEPVNDFEKPVFEGLDATKVLAANDIFALTQYHHDATDGVADVDYDAEDTFPDGAIYAPPSVTSNVPVTQWFSLN